jgi:hypothetical protein
MSAAKLVLFTMMCFSVCAQAQTLAIYPQNTTSFDSHIRQSIQEELDRLLSPAGIHVAWRAEGHASREEFGRLVVARFEGSCSVENLPSYASGSVKPQSLAQTAISDGRITPYFSVNCARVIRTLTPTLQHLSVPFRNAVLGRALARVIAHEIYHIVAQTTHHEEIGLSKAELSLRDLTAGKFELSPESLRRIRASIQTPAPVPLAGLIYPAPLPR